MSLPPRGVPRLREGRGGNHLDLAARVGLDQDVLRLEVAVDEAEPSLDKSRVISRHLSDLGGSAAAPPVHKDEIWGDMAPAPVHKNLQKLFFVNIFPLAPRTQDPLLHGIPSHSAS